VQVCHHSLDQDLEQHLGRVARPRDRGAATPFDKEGLEALLRKEHSQRVSNIYDSEHSIQYTWDIDNQVLCPGVDGKCEKEEL